MDFSQHSLHPPVVVLPEHKAAVEKALALIVGKRESKARSFAGLPDSFDIPITTVSLNSNFDAYIDVQFNGATPDTSASLLVDSGNSVLIVPRWEDIESVPQSKENYELLGAGQEPWGCPANIVRGPIELATASGDIFTIENCVFYACTGDSPADGTRTANFGAGCLSPWTVSGWNTPAGPGVTLQAPLSYIASYPYAEFNYAPASTVLNAKATPMIAAGSFLTMHTTMPSGYQALEIVDKMWMALIAKSLGIGDIATQWPGSVDSPIALIDTGGTCVFLSDPNGYVYKENWPDLVANPSWASSSQACQSTSDNITVEIGDLNKSYTYKVDTSTMPPSVQGLTLVMCESNYYMMGEQGMNIGGISALVNFILVDYNGARVGMKSK